jgi:hypothetical protein
MLHDILQKKMKRKNPSNDYYLLNIRLPKKKANCSVLLLKQSSDESYNVYAMSLD